ncbi:MAG: pyridoxamine 5'-phosphate oxidase [Schleiferiaceae bacterium]|jgi:pyridoxamine 5'-phosphate oxidase
MALHDDRKEYVKGSLDDRWLNADPLVQFAAWLEEYRATGVEDSTAFALSTVSAEGQPDARIVLLKELRGRDMIFFTNYASKKGRDLDRVPSAHALFFWPSLERQIRIGGRVRRIPASESDAYFASRPLGSQWGAAASDQSQPIASRSEMEQRLAEVQRANPDGVVRPEHWGGFALAVDRIEFWQGRASRLHDRIQFHLSAAETWTAQRLQP